MKFIAIFSTFVLAAVSVSADSCPFGDCGVCTSPTGCPGSCIQSDIGPLCNGFCGGTAALPCSACEGQGNANCAFDSTGTTCSIVHVG